MTSKRKLLLWSVVAVVWLYLLIDSHGLMRVGAAILLIVSIAVPVLDAVFTRRAKRDLEREADTKASVARK